MPVSATEDQLRTDVAVCSRLLVADEILSYSGHISTRLPGSDHILIQRAHDVRAQLEPGRLLIVDEAGECVDGSGTPPDEVFIHTEIYRVRPDVGAVAHFHHDPTTVFSTVEGAPIVAVKNHAARWASGVPVHPDASHIATPAQGAEVAATLALHHALLLRGHGEVIVAEDVRTLYADVVHFVENATALRLAMQLGKTEPLTPDDLARFLATFRRARHAVKLWTYSSTVAASHGIIPQDWVLGQE